MWIYKGHHLMKRRLSQNQVWFDSLGVTLLLIYVVGVHGTMLFWDIQRPNAFLSADRSLERMAEIAELRLVRMQSKRIKGEQRFEAQSMTGYAVPGVVLRVVDFEEKDVSRDGKTTGEIIARIDNVTAGYRQQPAASAEDPRGGWFHTGDMATINDDGSILIVDRRKDIGSGGVHISSLRTFLATHGIVGDYFPQALLYLVGGRYLVIVFQVILMIGAVMAVYGITHLVTASPNASLAASLLYVHLPHSLVYPHMLASESIFDPLLVISFYLAAILFLDKARWSVLVASAVLLGCATLVRPITILWPLIAFIALLASRVSIRQALLYPLLALLPLLLWMGYIKLNTGVFSMGASSHDLGRNLYYRAKKIIDGRLPEHDRAQASAAFLHETFSRETMQNERVMTVRAYFRFCLHYPTGCLRFAGEDIAMYFAKSGVEKVTVDYLDLAPDVQELVNKPYDWRDLLYSQGVIGAFKIMVAKHPALILTSLTGTILTVLFWIFAEVGTLCVLSNNAYTLQQRAFIAMLGAFPFYIVGVSLVGAEMQSRHRAPAEFALCVLAVLGWTALMQRISLQTAHSSHSGPQALRAVSERMSV
jgi:AMP-binding enzyme/Dolichyl-phosphate-mannose-protein mannosyltransferase